MNFLAGRRGDAIASVHSCLNAKFERVYPAEASALAAKGLRSGWTGWALTVQGYHLVIAVDARFPYSIPKIFAADQAYLLRPHVEKFGRLCLSEDGIGVDPDSPALVVELLIDRAITLMRELDQGLHKNDYSRDFPAYWRRTDEAGPRVYTLIEDRRETRHLLIWHVRSLLFIAEDKDRANAWLDHRFNQREDRDFGSAFAIWLPSLPEPDAYPETVNELRNLCSAHAPQIDELLASGQDELVVLLQGPSSPTSVATGAVYLKPARRHGWSANVARAGFRPGKHPPANLLACTWRLSRSSVASVVASSSRMPPAAQGLKGKHVVVIGCGSLGAGVARLLVQSGIDRLTLIDPDVLGFENIMRHELGATSVGVEKTTGLARELLAEFPHITSVHAISDPWEEVVLKEGESAFDDADLILSLTGDWNAEVLLSDFARARPQVPPLIFGWMERGAAATHVLATAAGGPCFRCGFNAVGDLVLPATAWRAPLQDDGCAAPISPYGGIELANGQVAVAQAAIDVLLQRAVPPFRRAWLASTDNLEAQGGEWDPRWVAAFGEPHRGGQHVAATWPARDGCACRDKPR